MTSSPFPRLFHTLAKNTKIPRLEWPSIDSINKILQKYKTQSISSDQDSHSSGESHIPLIPEKFLPFLNCSLSTLNSTTPQYFNSYWIQKTPTGGSSVLNLDNPLEYDYSTISGIPQDISLVDLQNPESLYEIPIQGVSRDEIYWSPDCSFGIQVFNDSSDQLRSTFHFVSQRNYHDFENDIEQVVWNSPSSLYFTTRNSLKTPNSIFYFQDILDASSKPQLVYKSKDDHKFIHLFKKMDGNIYFTASTRDTVENYLLHGDSMSRKTHLETHNSKKPHKIHTIPRIEPIQLFPDMPNVVFEAWKDVYIVINRADRNSISLIDRFDAAKSPSRYENQSDHQNPESNILDFPDQKNSLASDVILVESSIVSLIHSGHSTKIMAYDLKSKTHFEVDSFLTGQVVLNPLDPSINRISYTFSEPHQPPIQYMYCFETNKKYTVSQALDTIPISQFSPALNPNHFTSQCLWTTDGKIPFTVYKRKEHKIFDALSWFGKSQPRKTLFFGYGAYNVPFHLAFRPSIVPLLMDGWTIVACHVRGGGEFPDWHNQGRKHQKINSIRDYYNIINSCISLGLSDPNHIHSFSASAGSLLNCFSMFNQQKWSFRSMVMESPFTDVFSSLVDESIPLTKLDIEEYGDPKNVEEDIAPIRLYDPVSNLLSNYFQSDSDHLDYSNTNTAPINLPPLFLLYRIFDFQVPTGMACGFLQILEEKLHGESHFAPLPCSMYIFQAEKYENIIPAYVRWIYSKSHTNGSFWSLFADYIYQSRPFNSPTRQYFASTQNIAHFANGDHYGPFDIAQADMLEISKLSFYFSK